MPKHDYAIIVVSKSAQALERNYASVVVLKPAKILKSLRQKLVIKHKNQKRKHQVQPPVKNS